MIEKIWTMRLRQHNALWICLVGLLLHCRTETRDAGSERLTGSRAEPTEGTQVSGYLLFSPLLSTTTYLIDRNGQVVHSWESELAPGVAAYLLDDGHLLRAGRHPGVPFQGAGQGGRLQEFDWDGTLLWDWSAASDRVLQHHDLEPLPDGNVLLIAWEPKSADEALQAGRRPDLLGPAGLWPDAVLEVEPRPPDDGRIVWEWHLWDHLIQGHDPRRDNYGRVEEHPELVDINAGRAPASVTEPLLRRLKALGYLGAGATAAEGAADFVHTNSVDYDPVHDQIVLSVSQYQEIWVLDHGTTSREAAGHSGGRRGKGGDLLYRWGNPQAYRRGSARDQWLFGQHDARWIPPGFPGAGRLLVFDNGAERPGRPYSSVLELEPPRDAAGNYQPPGPDGFEPEAPSWRYVGSPRSSFFAEFLSGAERLRNGNTLICAGPQGLFFEVAPDGRTLWQFQSRFTGDAPNPAGDPPYAAFRVQHVPPDHPAVRLHLGS